MSKLLALLTAIAHLLHRVLDAIGEHKIRQQRSDYEQDIQDIRDDPVGYANDKFGGVRDPEAEADDMHGNDTAGSGDSEPQRTGNHPG